MNKLNIRNQTTDFLIFTKETGGNGIEVRVEDETIWLTQKLMAELFDCTAENIIHHLKSIYADDELTEAATTKDFLVVRQEGSRTVNRKVKHYNLDAIIAVARNGVPPVGHQDPEGLRDKGVRARFRTAEERQAFRSVVLRPVA